MIGTIKEIVVKEIDSLSLMQFKEMDYYAVENYSLPIELMMENAGLQLANLVVTLCSDTTKKILVGVGNGNNGGGGLVAARRLAAWGYDVYLDPFTEITKELPLRQMERALKFGAKNESISNPDVWVDAYLGFSQRLPLRDGLVDRITQANQMDGMRISLDIPTGFLGDLDTVYFEAEHVMSLAAPKKILFGLKDRASIYIADLGIPKEVYQKFGIELPPFYSSNILKISNN